MPKGDDSNDCNYHEKILKKHLTKFGNYELLKALSLKRCFVRILLKACVGIKISN